MIRRIPSERRHYTDAGWLKTYWLFSFGDYYDPENTGHGTLHVFNDDIVSSQYGFPDHPHNNYEIITVILEGELTHHDSAGNRGVIKSGDVQRMSAGSGVLHSEFNYGKDPVHLYQIWIKPNKEDLSPSYEQRHFNFNEMNHLVKFVSPEGENGLLIHSDSSLYYGKYDQDRKLVYTTDSQRKIFIYLTEGSIRINNVNFTANDQARIEGESTLFIQTVKSSKFIVIDVPAL